MLGYGQIFVNKQVLTLQLQVQMHLIPLLMPLLQ